VSKFYIVGGRQRRRGEWVDEWRRYDRGVIAELDSDTGATVVLKEYESPADACPLDEDPAILYKAATLEDGVLYACTQTEVMAYEVPSFRELWYVSLPCFNDVHHVRPTADGTVLVVSTGLDLVVEVTTKGEIVNEWNVLGQDTWERFSRTVDYRKVLTTKPHESHPNYVFENDNEYWATRLEKRDAVCLTGDGRIAVGREPLHDGLVRDGKIYFTTVNGHILEYDARSLELVRDTDLNEFCALDDQTVSGWCRGIEVLGPDLFVVGFSRVRETAFRKNLRWVKARALGDERIDSQPTRVAAFDLGAGELVWEHGLEDVGLNAVFSVHRVPA
jgi:outer membrane protein assembly factor BamB